MSDANQTLTPGQSIPLSEVETTLNRRLAVFKGPDDQPVQRARMSNLVIFCNSLEQSIGINEQITAITAVHPMRTILLVGEPGADRELTARVTVRPVGDPKNHVCVEMVTLHAGRGNVERLPFAVRSLLLGDLPVNLWWQAPVPPPFAGASASEPSLLGTLGATMHFTPNEA